MSDRVAKSNSSHLTSRLNTVPSPSSEVGVVIDIVLDETHERVQQTPDGVSGYAKDTSVIGSAVIRRTTDSNTPKKQLNTYPPFTMIDGMPIIGERVQLFSMGGRTYYKRFTNGNVNVGNAFYNSEKILYPELEPGENTVQSYKREVQIQTSGESVENEDVRTYGKYFTKKKINPLKYYEGDTILQSRFGQSIRFSGYNNGSSDDDKTFSPTIVIRNRQREDPDIEIDQVIEEDVNRDGSVIVLSSKDHTINFKEGSVDKKGSNDFKSSPKNFEDFPNKYTGADQVLINSDRLVFSSKTSEMIFFSKGNYGFISDGKLSIDNGEAGADLEFNGDVNLKTINGNNVYINGSKRGSIFLNTKSRDEPLVRGDTLLELLRELIDAINQQVYLTPAGPTSTGPTNRVKFLNIKTRLANILSTLNYTE